MQKLIIFAAIATPVIVKVIINVYKFARLQYLYNKYMQYLKSFKSGNPTFKFNQYKREIIELLRQADIKSSALIRLTYTHPGYALKNTIDLFENMDAYDEEVCNLMMASFNEAIGVYKKRAYDSINPIYWLEFLIFLPQNIVSYFAQGAADIKNNMLIRIINLFYWLICLIASILTILPYVKK